MVTIPNITEENIIDISSKIAETTSNSKVKKNINKINIDGEIKILEQLISANCNDESKLQK
jgi:hypothetical protein